MLQQSHRMEDHQTYCTIPFNLIYVQYIIPASYARLPHPDPSGPCSIPAMLHHPTPGRTSQEGQLLLTTRGCH
jgi:hypothetical protein